MEEDDKIDKLPLNQQGGIDGCAIASIGLLMFFVGLGLFILGAMVESGLLIILGIFFGTLVAGFFILYPIVRLLFGGRDSILTALTTAYLEGVITNKIVKNARKKRRRY